MLILRVKWGEPLLIGNDIAITLLEPDGTTQVKVGVQAPRSVDVKRHPVAHREALASNYRF